MVLASCCIADAAWWKAGWGLRYPSRRARDRQHEHSRARLIVRLMPTRTDITDPMTPPEVLAMRKGNSLKPDAQGRLIFRPHGVVGPGYVVENVEQLRRAKRFHAIKLTLGTITVGAALGSVVTMQESDDLARATGAVAVVLLLAAVLVYHSVAGWRRVVSQTAMRPLP